VSEPAAGPVTVPVTEDVSWHRVDHGSAVGAVRRAAVALGERLGLGESLLGEIGIVATELAGNQVKHAGGGNVLLRACRAPEGNGVELVAIDAGPGMGDVPQAFGDGHSTAGTLGIGLGAVRRLTTSLDVFSAPGRGTVIAVSIGPDGVTRAGRGSAIAGLTRPLTGEAVCGDGYAVRVDAGVLTAVLLDGLGHGPLAATATATGVRAFLDAPPGGAAELLTRVHRALAGTRGAAAAVLRYDGGDEVRLAGIGNISGHVFGGERRRGMVSYPGIAGGQARTVREAGYPFPARGTVVLHSDGVSDRLALPDPGLPRRGPLVVAALCLRDYGVRADDASVLVLTRGDGGSDGGGTS